MIRAIRGLAHAVHGLLHQGGEGVVEFVGGLAVLEIDIGVLRRAACVGMLRVHGAAAEGGDGVTVDQLRDGVVRDDLDGAQLVARAESVEEVEHGHAPLDGGEVCN